MFEDLQVVDCGDCPTREDTLGIGKITHLLATDNDDEESREGKHPRNELAAGNATGKDTNRDEAQAMLEFAYTGEVNVAQDLLPTLLHTARSYKIKGLDKESVNTVERLR